ncbi:MAG: hypothetical protein NT062_01320 [Proteobacteria bacterium]|nr:hypothetical protein [Pseudomonadota bacterium]
MRWPAVVVILTAGSAHADPRDVFGLPTRPVEPPLDCGDGRAFGCARATDPLDDRAPFALTSWLPAAYLQSLPVADATHDAVAHYATGAARDDAGVLFAGATGLENRWTIDGAPADNVRFGSVDTRVPLAFLRGVFTMAGGFTARDRASTGGTVDAELIEGGPTHVVDVRAWASLTGDYRRRAIAANTFQLRRLYGDAGPDGTVSIVASGPLPSIARSSFNRSRPTPTA